jgi:hypothetical protein
VCNTSPAKLCEQTCDATKTLYAASNVEYDLEACNRVCNTSPAELCEQACDATKTLYAANNVEYDFAGCKTTCSATCSDLCKQACDTADAFAQNNNMNNDVGACTAECSGLNPPTAAPATTATPEPIVGGCVGTQFGCCGDGVTGREDEAGTNCPAPPANTATPEPIVGGCGSTQFSCCGDGVTGREDEAGTNCPEDTTPATNGDTAAGEAEDGANPTVLETELSLEEALGLSAAGSVTASLGIALGAALLTTKFV